MLAILNCLNAHNFPIFQLILMILVSKFMVHISLSNKLYFIRVAVPFNFVCILLIFLIQTVDFENENLYSLQGNSGLNWLF